MNDDLKDDFENTNIKEEENKVPESIVSTNKYLQKEKIFSKIKDLNSVVEEVFGPSDYIDNIEPRVTGLKLPEDENTAKWAQGLALGVETTMFDGQYINALKQPGANFTQIIEHGGQSLKLESPNLKRTQNQNLDGDKALMYVRNRFNLGSYVRVPLYHSGFWITLKAPSESDILELHRIHTQDKIDLGRSTYGLAFSSQTVFFSERILDFAIENIHSHSIKTNRNIKEFIYSHDIPIIVAALAGSIYPNGFKYIRSCINDPEKCQHVNEELINISKTLWTNESLLNDWQKQHMSNKSTGSMTEESLIRYRAELLNNQNRKVTISKNSNSFDDLDDEKEEISFILKTPTAQQWFEQGTTWINSIVETITKSLSSTDSVAERNRHSLAGAKAATLRQYSHWIESIEIDSNIIDKRETLVNVLSDLSSDDVIRDELIKKIREYIDDTLISLIGIPSFNCPVCKLTQDEEDIKKPNFVNIIPIDPVNTFFILIVQRIMKIQAR